MRGKMEETRRSGERGVAASEWGICTCCCLRHCDTCPGFVPRQVLRVYVCMCVFFQLFLSRSLSHHQDVRGVNLAEPNPGCSPLSTVTKKYNTNKEHLTQQALLAPIIRWQTLLYFVLIETSIKCQQLFIVFIQGLKIVSALKCQWSKNRKLDRWGGRKEGGRSKRQEERFIK